MSLCAFIYQPQDLYHLTSGFKISSIDYAFWSILESHISDREEWLALRSRLQILANKWTHIFDAAPQTIAWKWYRDGSLGYVAVKDSMLHALRQVLVL